MTGITQETWFALAALGGAVLVGIIGALIGGLVLRRAGESALIPLGAIIHRHTKWPLRWFLPFLFLFLALPGARPDLPVALARWLDVGLGVMLPVLFGWVLVAVVGVVEESVVARLDLDAPDNLQARKIYTQVRVLKRIALVGVLIFTLGILLMSYERLQQIGMGLLASAGLAGLVIGFAAQRTLGNLVAGFQIATTQPIRIDDVVVLEGEWGRIEEITLTYVVVRIWDKRRLVLPISYFIENPFQNWTRVSADILGTIFLWVDYTVPVASVREELHRILREETELWDGEVWGLQVTEAGERTLQLRALVSAPDSGVAWELRCLVREKLVEWMQREHPDALPRFRAEIDSGTPGRGGSEAPGGGPADTRDPGASGPQGVEAVSRD